MHEGSWEPTPPEEGSFRLGERLWAGHAGLVQAPACDFFPRQSYGAVVVPGPRRLGACSLLLLGGSQHGYNLNDVWRLLVPCGGPRGAAAEAAPAGPRWTAMSPHDEGKVDGQGRRTMQKWKPRQDFGCCAAASAGGGCLVYVAGGSSHGSLLSDIWASEDGGATWVCMNSGAPWEKRRAAALCAVPGRPERLLLAGGMAPFAEVCGDVWASDDAGYTWTELEAPPWAMATGRYRSALLPLPPAGGEEPGAARLLLLGGCFIDGQDGSGAANPGVAHGAGGGGTIGLERLMHDAWECHLDLAPGIGAQSASWQPWGTDAEHRGARMAKRGVEAATATLDATGRALVAHLPERPFVSVAEACPPRGMSLEWHAAQAPAGAEAAAPAAARPTDPAKAGQVLTYVRMASAGPAGVPRLLVVNTAGAWLTGRGEWRRQARLAALVGLRVEAKFRLPRDLWLGRVLPCLLPEVASPAAAAAAGQRAAPQPAPGDLPAWLVPLAHAGLLWEVVGGADKGGIIARAGREIASRKLEERLSCGALVRQEELAGERLRFARLTGSGPEAGWVSLRLQDRELLARRRA